MAKRAARSSRGTRRGARRAREATIEIKVGQLPGQIGNYVLGEDRTVQAALEAAGLDGGGEVRVNGEPAALDKTLRQGDTVLVTAEIRGN